MKGVWVAKRKKERERERERERNHLKHCCGARAIFVY